MRDGLLGSYRRESKRWCSADYCGRNERLKEWHCVSERLVKVQILSEKKWTTFIQVYEEEKVAIQEGP